MGGTIESPTTVMDGALKRSLTLTDLTLFGVVSIMGSGGFNLIGEGVRSGGSLWPLAIAIPALLLTGSAFTYASAFERFKKNTAEPDMIQSVFGSGASFLGGSSILIYNIVSIVVILVICSKLLLPTGSWWNQVGLTIAFMAGMSWLALLGIDVNKDVVTTASWALIGILLGAVGIGGWGLLTQPMPTVAAPSATSFMNSVWMFFFVLVGFDMIMKFSQETKKESDIPKALYLSNEISIALTVGMAAAIAIWLPGLTAANQGMAIELLFAKFFGGWITEPFKWLIVMFLLITTFVVFLATTRYLYGLNEKADWLADLKKVNAAKAPWMAIASVFGSGSVLALLNNTDLLVKITDLGFASVATLVAGSVAVADWRDGKVGSAAVSGATGAGFLGLIASAFL